MFFYIPYKFRQGIVHEKFKCYCRVLLNVGEMSTVLHSKLWVKVCIVVVVVGLVAAVYAYSRLSQTTAGPRVSVTSPPLEFSMELGKAEFQYGENITIKYRLENIGNETITIKRVNPPGWPSEYKETSYFNVYAQDEWKLREFHFGFRIMDTNGTEDYDMSGGILDYVYDLRIDPGGWIEQTITWDYYSLYHTLPLSLGTYQIKGVFRHRLNGGALYTLETSNNVYH